MTEEKSHSFETAFARLEAILQKMQAEHPTLDESINLYEEADTLIRECQTALQQAEKRIEQLVKDRHGQLILGPNQQPQTQKFP